MAVKRRVGSVLGQIGDLFNVGTIGDLTDGQLLERFATDPGEVAELAFSAVVERHGALVWRVCMALLRDPHDAEDAFQATFLVLVRRARSLWVRDSLAPWLQQVAYLSASSLRTRKLRRRRLDRRHAESSPPPAIDAEAPRDPDTDAAIHEELNGLPAKYRQPLILCDLEGQTHQQAARALGWPIGTIKSRQAQARSLLRDRLTRRGVGLATAASVAESLRQPAAASLAASQVRAAVDVAMQQAGRSLATPAIPSSVATLALAVHRTLGRARILYAGTAAVAVGLVAGMAFVSARAPRDSSAPDDPPTATRPAAPAALNGPPEKPIAAADLPLQQMLAQAVRAAESIDDPTARRLTLTRIAGAQATLHDTASAVATARLARQSADQIADEMQRRFALGRVARLQAKLGDVESARRAFDELARDARTKGPWDRMSQLAAVATEQHEGGLHADAMETLRRATEDARKVVAETSKGDIYYDIVFAQCQIGDFEGVLKIVEGLEGELANDRQTYLQYLARDCDKAGPAEARKILARALELSKAIPYIYPRGLTQKQIAQAMARNGDIPGALAASKRIGQVDDPPADGPLAFLNPFGQRERAARRQAEAATAPLVRNEVADVLAVIAAEQARTGDREASKRSFREAMDLTLAEDDVVLKTQRLRVIVEVLASVGELAAARVAIDAIRGNEANKALAQVALAKAEAKAGDKAAARATLVAAFQSARDTNPLQNLINDSVANRRNEALWKVQQAQLELGAFDDARETAALLGNPSATGQVQAGLAGRQAREDHLDEAMKTAGLIADPGSRAEAFRQIADARARAGHLEAARDWAASVTSPHQRALALLGVVEGVLARRRGD